VYEHSDKLRGANTVRLLSVLSLGRIYRKIKIYGIFLATKAIYSATAQAPQFMAIALAVKPYEPNTVKRRRSIAAPSRLFSVLSHGPG